VTGRADAATGEKLSGIVGHDDGRRLDQEGNLVTVEKRLARRRR